MVLDGTRKSYSFLIPVLLTEAPQLSQSLCSEGGRGVQSPQLPDQRGIYVVLCWNISTRGTVLQLLLILVSPFFPFKSVLSVLFLQIMFLSLDTPEENPYCPTYIFPELPEIQQKTEGTRSLVRVSVVLCFELTLL